MNNPLQTDLITWDQFLSVALKLQEQTKYGEGTEDKLFEDAWAFLNRAHRRYSEYKYGPFGPLFDPWDNIVFLPPTHPLDKAAALVTKIRNNGEALAVLKDLLLKLGLWERCERRGELGEEFCRLLRAQYQEQRASALREKQRQSGKANAKHLNRGKEKARGKEKV